MSFGANRFPSSQHTRYRSSWGPSSVSVFDRADVPRPSPEEEEYAEFYHERLHSAQSRQLIPLQEDLADWINKTISKVKNWALKFGVDLWEFGKQVTKMTEIQKNYYKVEANLIKRDGLVLVREMAAEVKNMMDFKMNAVMVSINDTSLFITFIRNPRSRMARFNALTIYPRNRQTSMDKVIDVDTNPITLKGST
ncbi:hypothetical protein HZH68_008835 [Vespula germanica]|uniref:Uncharacterized protein n=1 Tax=Vespula germanica TaxID=30212 RepID=A0A834JZP2_VESGE|nr:hypothetical protein HZH68_008835 [Vespula germanica]